MQTLTSSAPVAPILGFLVLWLMLYGIGNLIGRELGLSGERLQIFSIGFAFLGMGVIIVVGSLFEWTLFGVGLAGLGPVGLLLIAIGLLLWISFI